MKRNRSSCLAQRSYPIKSPSSACCRYPGQRVPSTLANISTTAGKVRCEGLSYHIRAAVLMADDGSSENWSKVVASCIQDDCSTANAKRGEVAHDHIPVWLKNYRRIIPF